MRTISKQDLYKLPEGTLLSRNYGNPGEPTELFILGKILKNHDGEPSDFFYSRPSDGGLFRDGAFDDEEEFIAFGDEDILDIIARLQDALRVQQGR